MLLSILAGLTLAPGPCVCPVTGEPIPEGAKAFDRNGVRYRFCGPSCVEAFKKDPATVLEAARKRGWTSGVMIFDPVSGRKLTPQTARGGTSDFDGVRFAFLNFANKSAFDADPKRFGAIPEKADLHCPVMDVELTNPYLAPGMADFGGIRYFACCETCFPKLRANPGQFAKADSPTIAPPKVYAVPDVWAKMTGPGI